MTEATDLPRNGPEWDFKKTSTCPNQSDYSLHSPVLTNPQEQASRPSSVYEKRRAALGADGGRQRPGTAVLPRSRTKAA